MGRQEGSGHYLWQLGVLCGHIIGSAIVFAVMLVCAWSIRYLSLWLHQKAAFDAYSFSVLKYAEIAALYLDIFLTLFVLTIGIIRFIKQALKE